MALDTVNKRKAVMHLGQPWCLVALSVPDASNLATQGERKVLLALSTAIDSTGTPPSFTAASFANGFALDAAGVIGVDWIADGVPVPAGAVYDRGLARSQAGLQYVCPYPANLTTDPVYISGKIARRRDGAMCVAAAGVVADYQGGWPVTNRGEVLATVSAPVGAKIGGVGFNNGFVCMSELS